MRTHYKILTFLLLSVVFFSCQNDAIVEIVVSPLDTIVKRSDTVVYKFTLTPDIEKKGKIGTLFVEDSQGETVFSKNYSTTEVVTGECVYIVPEGLDDLLNLAVEFSVIDENSGLESKISSMINLQNDNLSIYSFEKVQASFDAEKLGSKFIFNIEDNTINTEDGTSENGDLAFVFDDEYGYSILSPDADFIKNIFLENGVLYTTENKKSTKIDRFTGNWEEIDETTISTLQINSTSHQGGGNGIEDVKENEILAFETADGIKGVLKIGALVKDENFISIDIKFQKIKRTLR